MVTFRCGVMALLLGCLVVCGESAAQKKEVESPPKADAEQLRLAVTKHVMQLIKKSGQSEQTELAAQAGSTRYPGMQSWRRSRPDEPGKSTIMHTALLVAAWPTTAPAFQPTQPWQHSLTVWVRAIECGPLFVSQAESQLVNQSTTPSSSDTSSRWRRLRNSTCSSTPRFQSSHTAQPSDRCPGLIMSVLAMRWMPRLS